VPFPFNKQKKIVVAQVGWDGEGVVGRLLQRPKERSGTVKELGCKPPCPAERTPVVLSPKKGCSDRKKKLGGSRQKRGYRKKVATEFGIVPGQRVGEGENKRVRKKGTMDPVAVAGVHAGTEYHIKPNKAGENITQPGRKGKNRRGVGRHSVVWQEHSTGPGKKG